MDTLGVSFRYYSKFAIESGPFWLKFFPAVLQSGDSSGIMPMEFPFLNFIFAPFWVFGPEIGRIAIYLVLTMMVYGLTYFLFRVSKGWYRWGFLLFPSVSYATDYFGKFIPDTLSFLLVLAGIVLPFSRLPKDSKWVKLAPLFVTIGILMKPPAVVGVLFYFIVHPKIDRMRIVSFFKSYTIPVLIGGIYYTAGLALIKHFGDGGALFATTPKNPFESLYALAKNYPAVYVHFAERPWFYGGLPLMIVACFYRFRRLRQMIIIFLLQFLVVAALDGEHSFTHDYYYSALSPTCCVMMIYALFVLRKKWIGALILLALIIRPLEVTTHDVNHMHRGYLDDLSGECKSLREKNPSLPWHKGGVFRSTQEPFPSLELCFGEREASASSRYGFYYKDEKKPYGDCKVIDETRRLVLVDCNRP